MIIKLVCFYWASFTNPHTKKFVHKPHLHSLPEHFVYTNVYISGLCSSITYLDYKPTVCILSLILLASFLVCFSLPCATIFTYVLAVSLKAYFLQYIL